MKVGDVRANGAVVLEVIDGVPVTSAPTRQVKQDVGISPTESANDARRTRDMAKKQAKTPTAKATTKQPVNTKAVAEKLKAAKGNPPKAKAVKTAKADPKPKAKAKVAKGQPAGFDAVSDAVKDRCKKLRKDGLTYEAIAEKVGAVTPKVAWRICNPAKYAAQKAK
jgi:hypothetical protein